MLIKKKLIHLYKAVLAQKIYKVFLNYRFLQNVLTSKSIFFFFSELFQAQKYIVFQVLSVYWYRVKVKVMDTSIFNNSLIDFLMLLTRSTFLSRYSFNFLKAKKKYFTLLRSPFVYKKSREQLMFSTTLGLINLKLNSCNLFILEYLDFFFINRFKFFFSANLMVTKIVYL